MLGHFTWTVVFFFFVPSRHSDCWIRFSCLDLLGDSIQQAIGSDCANAVDLPLFQQHLQVNSGEPVVEVQLVGDVVNEGDSDFL